MIGDYGGNMCLCFWLKILKKAKHITCLKLRKYTRFTLSFVYLKIPEFQVEKELYSQ